MEARADLDRARRRLTRREASDAVTPWGWRYGLGAVRSFVPVRSLGQAAAVAARVTEAAGPEADPHLRLTVAADAVGLTLQTADLGFVTPRDVDLADRITRAVHEMGLRTGPGAARPVQALEIAIDALDVPAVRPFWRAVLAYVDEPGSADGLVDPAGVGPAFRFQQMDAPRPQRNRVHVDVAVSHDEAPQRIAAALAAGGVLVSEAHAPAFWVLADAEGNEACVRTWQGRD